MKTIQTTVTHKVPHWNYCNVDKFDMDGTPSKQLCRFCTGTKAARRCVLYDRPLMSDGTQVQKLPQCCKATAYAKAVVEPEQESAPTIDPKALMMKTIELYNKYVNELLAQHYPRAIAEQIAKHHLLGG